MEEHEMPRDGQPGSALGKSLAVLETVIERPGPATLGTLAFRLGMPKQTVHRIVRQLAQEGLIERTVSGDGYVAGRRLKRLVEHTLFQCLQAAPVRAILQRLVDDLEETCNIGVLDGAEVIYVERVECDWPLRMQLQPGSRVPAYCTGIGKMLLASLDARTRRRLVENMSLQSFTERTITGTHQLLYHLKQIRRQGFALNDQENTVGMMGLAVPIAGDDGNVVAGLAVHAPVARLSPDAALEKLSNLQSAADEIGRAIRIDEGGTNP